MIPDLPFDQWLRELLPSPEQWAVLSSDIRDALSSCVAHWKLFLNSVMLNDVTKLSTEVLVRHRSYLISQVLALEGIPLSVVKHAALLLVAIAYHTQSPLSHQHLSLLMRAIQLQSGLPSLSVFGYDIKSSFRCI